MAVQKMNRPDFENIKSFEEFNLYYWYRSELSAICRGLGLSCTGTKEELNEVIEKYFKGIHIKSNQEHKYKKNNSIDFSKITLDSYLLEINFSLNTNFRQYFSKVTGIDDFKFTADMAAAWRMVKKNQIKDFTLRDMLNVFKGLNTDFKYDASVCQWNQFLKDFCNSPESKDFSNKLETAAKLWNILRETTLPKKYTREFFEEHKDILK